MAVDGVVGPDMTDAIDAVGGASYSAGGQVGARVWRASEVRTQNSEVWIASWGRLMR